MTKPHFRIRSDGWIVHDGSKMPVPGETLVNVRTVSKTLDRMAQYDGYRADSLAKILGLCDWWQGNCDHRITAYRLT